MSWWRKFKAWMVDACRDRTQESFQLRLMDCQIRKLYCQRDTERLNGRTEQAEFYQAEGDKLLRRYEELADSYEKRWLVP